ncbi:MAG: haloacid dehalogenase-like hydrolase [Gemmataceae bacterium]|nr:haloacid dehalogenase-like hydrolase [Gemmataceae bacterium]
MPSTKPPCERLILLWDIDGTLVRSGGAGKAAMEAALRSAFGVPEVRDGVPYSGRTDGAIARDLLAVHDLDPSPANVQKLQAAYLDRLPDALANRPGEVCPGIAGLLPVLAERPDVVLGLLTGNVRAGARVKLGHFGLWDYFSCGGFGDGHHDRDDVARSAVADVRRHLGRDIDPADIWVIGDTPLDVQCARAVGAKAVAVATGWHPGDELTACGPDLFLDDLSDHAPLFAAWG